MAHTLARHSDIRLTLGVRAPSQLKRLGCRPRVRAVTYGKAVSDSNQFGHPLMAIHDVLRTSCQILQFSFWPNA